MKFSSYCHTPLSQLRCEEHSCAGTTEATIKEIVTLYNSGYNIHKIEGEASRYQTIRITHHNGNYDLVQGTPEEIAAICMALIPKIKE